MDMLIRQIVLYPLPNLFPLISLTFRMRFLICLDVDT